MGEAAATASAAAASESPCGGSEDGALRSGTDSSVPWLVSVEAVATSASQYAAACRRSSQPAGTTTSELRITTSAGAHARKASFMLRTKPALTGWRA